VNLADGKEPKSQEKEEKKAPAPDSQAFLEKAKGTGVKGQSGTPGHLWRKYSEVLWQGRWCLLLQS
jgi:hypothetical protein